MRRLFASEYDDWAGRLWGPRTVSLRCRHGHERRSQHTIGNQVAALQHGYHRIGLQLGGHHGDCLMAMGVELLAHP